MRREVTSVKVLLASFINKFTRTTATGPLAMQSNPRTGSSTIMSPQSNLSLMINNYQIEAAVFKFPSSLGGLTVSQLFQNYFEHGYEDAYNSMHMEELTRAITSLYSKIKNSVSIFALFLPVGTVINRTRFNDGTHYLNQDWQRSLRAATMEASKTLNEFEQGSSVSTPNNFNKRFNVLTYNLYQSHWRIFEPRNLG